MCRRVRCASCGKPSYAGCGAHVEQVLAGVPVERRCHCRDEAARPGQGLLGHRPSRPLGRLLLFVLGGAVLGLLYQRLVGCSTGSCFITSSPYISTFYGAALGLLLSAGLRGRRPVPRNVETLK